MQIIRQPFNEKPTAGTAVSYTAGGLNVWEDKDNGREIQTKIAGQFTFSKSFNSLKVALDGLGLAYIPEELNSPYVEESADARALEILVAMGGLPHLLSKPPPGFASFPKSA